MSSQVLVFCGKGGVGKTTISLAHALERASAGKRVLMVTSHPLSELAVAVSLQGLSERAAAKNLFLVHLDAHEMLAEIVHKNFPVPAAADRVVRSAIFRNLVEVAPGLKEFYFLARLQQLVERETYDLTIWDAPATGHFLSTLRAAKNFEHYLSGPLATAGADVARFFSNPANINALPVTTLEEMAMQETIEMAQALESGFQLKAGTVILNMVSPILAAKDDEATTLAEPESRALRIAIGRGFLERERAGEIRQKLDARTLPIPRLRHGATDLDLLDRIAGHLGELQ